MAVSTLKVFDPTAVKSGESLSGIIHTCDLCGRCGRWNIEWSMYGSLADEEAGVVLKACGCKRPSSTEAESLLAAKRKQLGRPAKVSRQGYHVW